MNKLHFLLIICALVIFGFTSDKKPQTYSINIEKSNIEWIGKKLTGSHAGTIKLKSGTLLMKGTEISGGAFIMDMTSIKVTDIASDNPQNAKLLHHIEGVDFFDVAKFPEANLQILNVVKKSPKTFALHGDLTIKGVKQPFDFTAEITGQTKNSVIARGKLEIDRTKFGILYKSSAVGEMMINDIFELNVKIAAVKS